MFSKALLVATFFLLGLPASATILKRSCDAEPASMNIHTASDAHTFSILRDLYETLVELKADGTLKPAAAKSIKISDDKKTYIFSLRKSAKWSNGDPVTAHDFVYSWRQVVTPATACPYANHVYMITNAEAIVKGNMPPEKLGVKALDDYHFEVKLTEPVHHFLSLLYHPPFAPLHKKSKEDAPQHYTRAGKLVSNGAFKLTGWVMNNVVKTTKNPHYHAADRVKLDGVEYYPVESQPQLLKYRAGELDIATSIPDDKMISITAGPLKSEVANAPFFGMMYTGFNLKEKPFDDIRVREALSLVIDRKKIISSILHSGQEPLYSWNFPKAASYKVTSLAFKDIPMADRIKRAQQLLKEAGYSPEKPLTFTLSNSNSAARQKILTAIRSMWKEHLPINMTVKNSEFKVFSREVTGKKYQIYMGGLVGLYNDPHTFASLMLTNSGMNMVGYADTNYDKLVKAAAIETDLNKRTELYAKSERLLLDHHPIIPLVTMTSPKLVKPYVKGFKPNIMNVYYAKNLWIEK